MKKGIEKIDLDKLDPKKVDVNSLKKSINKKQQMKPVKK